MAITSFIPKLWEARLLRHLDNALIARNFYNQDYEGHIRDQGDTVRINMISSPEIFDYNRNQDMPAPENLATTPQELVVDQAKAFSFQIDDIDRVQAKAELVDAAMERAAFELSSTEDGWLFGLLADGTPAANRITIQGAVSPGAMYDILVQMRTIMARNNVPSQGRAAALPPEAIALILRDERFVQTGSNQAEGRLATGFVGRAAGFDIFESNTTPGGNTVVAGNRIGATFASQIVQTEAYRMERRFSDGLKGLSVYGARVTRPQVFATARL